MVAKGFGDTGLLLVETIQCLQGLLPLQASLHCLMNACMPLICTLAHATWSYTGKGLHTIIAALSAVASAAVKHACTNRVSAAGMAPASLDSGFLS